MKNILNKDELESLEYALNNQDWMEKDYESVRKLLRATTVDETEHRGEYVDPTREMTVEEGDAYADKHDTANQL